MPKAVTILPMAKHLKVSSLDEVSLSSRMRKILSLAILVISVILFTGYAKNNPSIFSEIAGLGLGHAVLILLLYFIFLLFNAFILSINVKMCSSTIKNMEGFLLNAYSTIVNFFGPLQSGPGFRAIYLKKRLGIKLRHYGLASIYYYLFYAYFSSLILLGAWNAWSIPFLLFGAPVVAIVAILLSKKYLVIFLPPPKLLLLLALATMAQVILGATIYFFELRSIDASVSLTQTLIYTGTANFAMYISLTPGAIGVRESFLLFAQRAHGIESHTIIAASVIDRAIYFVFLGFIFILTFSLHAKSRLETKSAEKDVLIS
jgi:uncharacterized membrane protein YbhN (UPF0104 family)